MSIREHFFKVMRRQEEGFIPYEFWFCNSFKNIYRDKTGSTLDPQEYYNFPVRFIAPDYIGKHDYSKYYKDYDMSKIKIDQYGTGHRKGTYEHFTQIISPMRNATLEEIKEFPFVDPVNDYDWDKFALYVKELQSRDLIVYGALACTIFEVSWGIRGFEEFMMDLYDESPIADYIMDKVLNIRLEFAKRYAELGVDCLHLGDDVSTQIAMMMSPELWRKTLKPRMEKIINTAKKIKPDMIMDYHGDGNLQAIIPDLIEIGIEILNPVQPECMDPFEIKEKYGDKLSFRGCLGTQTTLPFGTVQDVKDKCNELLDKMGKGGGFMLCPTHLIEPEVPWDNFMAYFNIIKERNEKYI